MRENALCGPTSTKGHGKGASVRYSLPRGVGGSNLRSAQKESDWDTAPRHAHTPRHATPRHATQYAWDNYFTPTMGR